MKFKTFLEITKEILTIDCKNNILIRRFPLIKFRRNNFKRFYLLRKKEKLKVKNDVGLYKMKFLFFYLSLLKLKEKNGK